jgi:hypothetical protein
MTILEQICATSLAFTVFLLPIAMLQDLGISGVNPFIKYALTACSLVFWCSSVVLVLERIWL